MIQAIIHGVILAFGLILPLGAQNVFVFNQGALQPKLTRALPVVITAGICDTILIVAAVSGVSLLILTFEWLETIIIGIGILFLLYIGISLWRTNSSPAKHEGERFSPRRQIIFAASVSLLNPHAILDTIGVIGSNALSYTGDERMAFTVATILVAWCWFFGLALTGRLIGRLDTSGTFINVLNKISAVVVFGVAIYMVFRLLE
ncbi:LysE/ArgO family amino acid transporter [Sporosarcina saromensis]|uniref:LysE/ArgO family amino acid transporter n=1 Tax=Sporosarcina saromensis TaxID=359365 RepID=A0ABU4GEC7_9BACL|nr:LysE/ArgO family amino acid transporter [Sporosarcina saromensis]MDW0115271.1 LysE/ArgO family amino acid transporter [Sporosarcina saromensis]